MDWPFFLGVIFGYLLINVSVKKALYNWYNLLPIAVFLTHLFFALRVAGLWGNWEYGLGRWKSMFLVYPFKKVITHAQAYHYDLGAIIKIFNNAYTFSWYIAAFSALIISATFFFSVIKTIKLRVFSSGRFIKNVRFYVFVHIIIIIDILAQETILCQGKMCLITKKYIFLFPHIWYSAWNAWNSSNGAIYFDKQLNIPIDLIKVYIQIKTRYVSKNCASWKTISHICWALLLDFYKNIEIVYKVSLWRRILL